MQNLNIKQSIIESQHHFELFEHFKAKSFLLVFLLRSCFCQSAIFKVIDLECIGWSQIKDHCLYTQKSTNCLSIKASFKVLDQFLWKLHADKETKIAQMI